MNIKDPTTEKLKLLYKEVETIMKKYPDRIGFLITCPIKASRIEVVNSFFGALIEWVLQEILPEERKEYGFQEKYLLDELLPFLQEIIKERLDKPQKRKAKKSSRHLSLVS